MKNNPRTQGRIKVPSGKDCQCGRCRPCRRRAEREAKKPLPKPAPEVRVVGYSIFETREPETKPVFHA